MHNTLAEAQPTDNASSYDPDMCGRYTLTQPDKLAAAFGLDDPRLTADLPPRYNIAPTQPVPVIYDDRGQRQLMMMRWGLIPQWMNRLDGNKPPAGWINARSETAADKPAFRGAFKYRRCLIPADGFYEWQRDPTPGNEGKRASKQPHLIRRADDGLFAFAGLFEWWCPPDGSELPTCTILTTQANQTLRPLHERMPVLLEPEHHQSWLTTPGTPGSREPGACDVAELLRPCADDRLYPTPVSTRVNRVAHDDPACLSPAPDFRPPHTQQSLF